MTSDDASLRIILTEETPTVSSSENQSVDSGSSSTSSSNTPEGQSRFYQRYPWMKAGSREAPFVQASSPYGPFEKAPDEPWAGARTNPTGKAQVPGKEEELDYWGANPSNGQNSYDDIRSNYIKRERDKYQSDQDAKNSERQSFKDRLDDLETEAPTPHTSKKGSSKEEESLSERFKRMFPAHGAQIMETAAGGMAGSMFGGTAGAIIGSFTGKAAGNALAGMGGTGLAISGASLGIVAVMESFRKLRESTDEAVKSLKGISGQVAGAEAYAQVANLQALLRQNNQIGAALAEHVRKQADISANMTDIQTGILDAFTPLQELVDNVELALTGIAKEIARGVNYTHDKDTFNKGVLSLINVMDALNRLDGPNQVPANVPQHGAVPVIPHGMFGHSHLHHG